MAQRAAIYIRVSTEEQHLNGLSLPAQRKALTEYAENQGYTIIGCYADEGISARKPMKHRKALIRLLNDVEQGKVDMILVTKLDRWFRNIKDYNITEEILRAHNCHWKTIFENYDSSTANGQMVINIMLSVNQAECDRTSERIKAVFEYKRQRGLVISGMMAPYGYTVVDGKVVKDEKTRHIVEDAYDCYFKTYSIRRVLKHLQETYGEDAPSVNKVDRLFKNEKYCGRCGDDTNFCEPYITPEQLHLAKQISKSKTITTQYEKYIFSSLIKCPICGNNYTGYRKKKRLKDGGMSIYIRYRCANKFDKHSYPSPSEKTVEEYMLLNVFPQLEREIMQLEADSLSTQNKDESISITKEMDRLNIMYQKGRISDEYYNQQYETLSKQLAQCQTPEKVAQMYFYRKIKKNFTGDWLEMYHELDKAHKQVFWKSMIKDIQLDPQTRKICGFHFLDNLV